MIQQRGIGLAANQVGVNARLFVMLVDNQVFHCFNPEILKSSDVECELQEGCLSFPDQFLSITRPQQIHVQYANAHGKIIQQSLSGWTARCFQHELDHLNGITMHERQLGISSSGRAAPLQGEGDWFDSSIPNHVSKKEVNT